jgi:hypothetical protein
MISHGVSELLTFNGADFKSFTDISILSPERVLGM